MPPPTWYILRELAAYRTSNELIVAANQRKFLTPSIPVVFPRLLFGEEALSRCDKFILDESSTIATMITLPGKCSPYIIV